MSDDFDFAWLDEIVEDWVAIGLEAVRREEDSCWSMPEHLLAGSE